MAKPTSAQKNSHSPLDAAYVRATGRTTDANKPSWSSAGDWSVMGRAMIELEPHGGAIMLGRTRDGGQLTVAIYLRSDKVTHYFDNQDQALDYLEGVCSMGGAL